MEKKSGYGVDVYLASNLLSFLFSPVHAALRNSYFSYPPICFRPTGLHASVHKGSSNVYSKAYTAVSDPGMTTPRLFSA